MPDSRVRRSGLEVNPPSPPLDAAGIEAERLSVALLQQALHGCIVHPRAHERGREEQVQKPEHGAAGAAGLIGEPVLGAERMMQSGRRLEGHAGLDGGAEEAGEIGGGRKRVGGHAAGADFQSPARPPDGRRERRGVAGDRDLDVGLEVRRYPGQEALRGLRAVRLRLHDVHRGGTGALGGVAAVELTDCLELSRGVGPEQGGDPPPVRRPGSSPTAACSSSTSRPAGTTNRPSAQACGPVR